MQLLPPADAHNPASLAWPRKSRIDGQLKHLFLVLAIYLLVDIVTIFALFKIASKTDFMFFDGR